MMSKSCENSCKMFPRCANFVPSFPSCLATLSSLPSTCCCENLISGGGLTLSEDVVNPQDDSERHLCDMT